jgi:prophage regulatory protein
MANLLKMNDVVDKTCLSRSFLYDLIKKGQFPKPCKLAVRASAWVETEVDEWVQSQAWQ